jgi:hypothetical protein
MLVALPTYLCGSQSIATLKKNGHELAKVTDQNIDANRQKLGTCPFLVDK